MNIRFRAEVCHTAGCHTAGCHRPAVTLFRVLFDAQWVPDQWFFLSLLMAIAKPSSGQKAGETIQKSLESLFRSARGFFVRSLLHH
jgi:hypothetical protein